MVCSDHLDNTSEGTGYPMAWPINGMLNIASTILTLVAFAPTVTGYGEFNPFSRVCRGNKGPRPPNRF